MTGPLAHESVLFKMLSYGDKSLQQEDMSWYADIMYQDTYLKEIGRTIRRLRKERALTQADLAKLAESNGAPQVHRQDVSAMENGSFSGKLRKLQAVLRSLRYTLTATVASMPTIDELDDLFGDDDG